MFDLLAGKRLAFKLDHVLTTNWFRSHSEPSICDFPGHRFRAGSHDELACRLAEGGLDDATVRVNSSFN
jgi:hypothetical protein